VIPEHDLISEINLLRVFIARHISASGYSQHLDLKSQISVLIAINSTASMIACLARTQNKAHNPGTELSRAMEEALDELRKELNI
jgi:hypothetical protein